MPSPEPSTGIGFGQGDFSHVGELKLAKAGFDDSKWRTLDLPQTTGGELPFEMMRQKSHGYKPLGGAIRRRARLVPARVRDPRQRPGPPHLGRVLCFPPRDDCNRAGPGHAITLQALGVANGDAGANWRPHASDRQWHRHHRGRQPVDPQHGGDRGRERRHDFVLVPPQEAARPTT